MTNPNPHPNPNPNPNWDQVSNERVEKYSQSLNEAKAQLRYLSRDESAECQRWEVSEFSSKDRKNPSSNPNANPRSEALLE